MPHATPANSSHSDPVRPPISISTFLFSVIIHQLVSMPCDFQSHAPDCTTLSRWTWLLVRCKHTGLLFVRFPLRKQYVTFSFPAERVIKGPIYGPVLTDISHSSFLSEEESCEKSNSHDLFRYSGIELYLDLDSANTFLGSSHFSSDCQGSWAGSEELNLDHRRISSKLNGAFKAVSECWDCGNSLWSLRDYHIVSKEVARTPATFPDSEKRGSTNKPWKQVVYPWDWWCWIEFMNAKEIAKTGLNRDAFRDAQLFFCLTASCINAMFVIFLAPILLSLLFLLSHFLKIAWATEFNYNFLVHHGWNVISWSKGNSPRLHHWKKTLSPTAFSCPWFQWRYAWFHTFPLLVETLRYPVLSTPCEETTAALSQYTWWLCHIQKTSFCRKYPDLCFLDSS